MSDAPAGWYPDPESPGSHRYWDGHAWSDPTAPAAASPAPGIGFGAVPSAAASHAQPALPTVSAPGAFAPLDSAPQTPDVGQQPVAPIGVHTAIAPTIPPPTVPPPTLAAAPFAATAPYATPATPPPAAILSQRPAGTPLGLRLLAVALVGALTGGGLYLVLRSDDAPGADSSLAEGGSVVAADTAESSKAENAWKADRRLGWLNKPWQTQRSASGRYTFRMPGEAQQTSAQVPTPDGPVTISSSFIGHVATTPRDVGLALTVTDLASTGLTGTDVTENADDMLKNSAEGSLSSVEATLDTYETSNSALGPAYHFSGSSPSNDVIIQGFVVLHGADLVSFIVILPVEFDALADDTMNKAASSLIANW